LEFGKMDTEADKVTYVAFAADHLLAVVLGSQNLEGRLDHTPTETEDQVEGRLLLNVVVGKSAAILKLLSGKDQALLIRGDSLLVLCSFHQHPLTPILSQANP
jgi:hypothetical protein